MTGADFIELFPSYVWIDIEASSLSVDSWPIEFGWTGADLKAESFLIRPLAKWTDWSMVSEMIHGIRLEELFDRGIGAEAAAKRINEVCRDRQVLSDNPEMDAAWLQQLFHDAGVPQQFTLQDSRQLEQMAAVLGKMTPDWTQSITEQIKSAYPHPHRAGPDSRREAARFLALAMPHEIEEILAIA